MLETGGLSTQSGISLTCELVFAGDVIGDGWNRRSVRSTWNCDAYDTLCWRCHRRWVRSTWNCDEYDTSARRGKELFLRHEARLLA